MIPSLLWLACQQRQRRKWPTKYRTSASRRQIIVLIRDKGPMRPSQVAKALDKSPATINYFLTTMIADRQLVKVGEHEYGLKEGLEIRGDDGNYTDTPSEHQILELIEKNGPMSSQHIASALNRSRVIVANFLNAMVSKRQLAVGADHLLRLLSDVRSSEKADDDRPEKDMPLPLTSPIVS